MDDLNIQHMADLIEKKFAAESPNFEAYYDGRLHEFMDQNAVTEDELATADSIARIRHGAKS